MKYGILFPPINNKYKPINTLEQFYTFYYLFPLSRLIFWSSQIAIHSFRRLHYVTCKPRWYGREGKTDVVKLMNMAEEKKHSTLNHVSFLSNYSISFRTNIFLVFFNYQISLRWPLQGVKIGNIFHEFSNTFTNLSNIMFVELAKYKHVKCLFITFDSWELSKRLKLFQHVIWHVWVCE